MSNYNINMKHNISIVPNHLNDIDFNTNNEVDSNNVSTLDNSIIKNNNVNNIIHNNINISENNLNDEDNLIVSNNNNSNETENKIFSGDVYKHIDDSYYKDLNSYDPNIHGIQNSAIINDINVNTHKTLTNDYFSEFFNHDYTHLCHPDNERYDNEILKNLTNDHEFPFEYRYSYQYDNIINKFLHINFINNDNIKIIINKIFNILDSENYLYNKQKLILCFNEWALNSNLSFNNFNIIVSKFINIFKKFNHDYNLIFNKKILFSQNNKKFDIDFNVSKSSIFSEPSLYEHVSSTQRNKLKSHFNNFDLHNMPSSKYDQNHYNIK